MKKENEKGKLTNEWIKIMRNVKFATVKVGREQNSTQAATNSSVFIFNNHMPRERRHEHAKPVHHVLSSSDADTIVRHIDYHTDIFETYTKIRYHRRFPEATW